MFVAIGLALALSASSAGLVEGAASGEGQAVPEARITDAEILAARRAIYGPGFDHIEANGWIFVDGSDTTLVFTQPARQPRHIWARLEYKTLDDGVRSNRSLREVDCAGWRMRTIQFSSFSESNMGGVVNSSNETSEWRFPAPSTLGESILEAACER